MNTTPRPKNFRRPDRPPPWLWLLTLGSVVLIVLVAGLAAVWIAQGRTNPPSARRVVWSDAALAWADGPVLTLVAGQYRWFDAPPEARLPGDVFTLNVQARLAVDAGEGSAWGVWIETTGSARVLYAISGEGYTSTRECELGFIGEADACPALRPEWRWFAYPRIHPPGELNLITLHVEPTGEIRLRINHEIMGTAPVAWSGRWGVWVRGGRESASRLTWERASVRG